MTKEKWAEYMRGYYAKRKKQLDEIKREHGTVCADCGTDYSADLSKLAFHHLDKTTKQFSIGGHTAGKNTGAHGAFRSAAAIRGEMAKCVLLCASCHSKRHYAERKIEHGRFVKV